MREIKRKIGFQDKQLPAKKCVNATSWVMKAEVLGLEERGVIACAVEKSCLEQQRFRKRNLVDLKPEHNSPMNAPAVALVLQILVYCARVQEVGAGVELPAVVAARGGSVHHHAVGTSGSCGECGCLGFRVWFCSGFSVSGEVSRGTATWDRGVELSGASESGAQS